VIDFTIKTQNLTGYSNLAVWRNL